MKINKIKEIELIYNLDKPKRKITLTQDMIIDVEIGEITCLKNIKEDGIVSSYYKCNNFMISISRENENYDGELESKIKTYLDITSVKLVYTDGTFDEYHLPVVNYLGEFRDEVFEFNCLMEVDFKPNDGEKLGPVCISVHKGG